MEISNQPVHGGDLRVDEIYSKAYLTGGAGLSKVRSNLKGIVMSDAPDATQPTELPPDAPDDQVDAQNGGAPESGKASRPKPAKILPTDRIRPDKQMDILRAFAAVSGHERKAVTNEEVGAVVNMAASTISQIVPFFVDTGLIARAGDKKDAKGFIPSTEAMSYQKANEWDRPNAPKKLAKLLAASWFAQTLFPKLKFRAVNEKEAIDDLAEVAKVGPDKEESLRISIEYLVVTGLVNRDGAGMLHIGTSVVEMQQDVPPPNIPPPPPPQPHAEGGTKTSNVSDHQLWLLEILNAYPDLADDDQDAILKLIKTIKTIQKTKGATAP